MSNNNSNTISTVSTKSTYGTISSALNDKIKNTPNYLIKKFTNYRKFLVFLIIL